MPIIYWNNTPYVDASTDPWYQPTGSLTSLTVYPTITSTPSTMYTDYRIINNQIVTLPMYMDNYSRHIIRQYTRDNIVRGDLHWVDVDTPHQNPMARELGFEIEPMRRPPQRPHVRRSEIQADLQRDEVEARARELLLAVLSEEQRVSLRDNRWFEVVSRSGRRYRINGNSYSGNIHIMEGERRVGRLCCHLASGSMPFSDHLIAQKLMLEADEEEFLRLANRS